MGWKKLEFISGFAFCIIYTECLSEAWNQKTGRTQVISQVLIEEKNSYNSETGGVNNSKVQANHWSLYFEHGVKDRLNLGAQIYTSSYVNTDKDQKSFGIEYLNLFARQTIFDYNGKFTGALKALVKLPGVYDVRQNNEFFKKQRDYEASLELGYGASNNNYYLNPYDTSQIFVITALRYRYRDDIQFNETRIEMAIGHKIKDKYILMAEFQKINYIFDSDQESSANISSLIRQRSKLFSPTAFQGMAKMQLSFVRKIDDDYHVQVGYYRSIFSDTLFTNINHYDIDGVMFGLWCTI